jgi:hypothetical protein
MARKYITYMHIGLQDALVYRANAIIWMLVDSLPAYTMLLIWSAVYQGRQSIAGYTLGDMAAYYLAATFIGVAIEAHPEYSLSYEIRHGLLSPPTCAALELLLGLDRWRDIMAGGEVGHGSSTACPHRLGFSLYRIVAAASGRAMGRFPAICGPGLRDQHRGEDGLRFLSLLAC